MSGTGVIGIYGAGSIGCYVGGRLQAVCASVRFVGRERLRGGLLEHGLRKTDHRWRRSAGAGGGAAARHAR